MARRCLVVAAEGCETRKIRLPAPLASEDSDVQGVIEGEYR